jgi:hypothetical protein
MAARGSILVNLRNGAIVNTPDAFILGDVGAAAERLSPGLMSTLSAAILLVLLLPLGLLFLLLSIMVSGLLRTERLLGNKRIKSLTGENSRIPFTLQEFTFGPLLLRRWPGFFAILAGHLTLVGARAIPAENSNHKEKDLVFGLDVSRGLFQIWEVEGDLPETVEEQYARENFHEVTRTFGADVAVVLKAATTFPQQ